MSSNNLIMGAVALIVGAGIGFVVGQGEKEVVEVEKVVEVEATKTSTLDAVKSKGFVQCGVSQGLPGFSNADDSGKWTGIDVDLCRAVAAAVFGDPSKVKFSPLSANFSRNLIVSLAPIPSVCSSSVPSAASQLSVPP